VPGSRDKGFLQVTGVAGFTVIGFLSLISAFICCANNDSCSFGFDYAE